MNTLIALDVDGVLNNFSKSGKNLERFKIGEWPITVRTPVIDRLKTILARPDVTPAWLTTWVSEPAMLDELSIRLGLTDLVSLEAEWPYVKTGWGGDFILPTYCQNKKRLESARTPDWWKFIAWEKLISEGNFERAAWIDDEVGLAQGKGADAYKARATETRYLLRTHEIAGLLDEDLDKLEAWLEQR